MNWRLNIAPLRFADVRLEMRDQSFPYPTLNFEPILGRNNFGIFKVLDKCCNLKYILLLIIEVKKVLIICPNCKKRYKLDENKLKPKPVIKLKCPSCGFIFEVKNPIVSDSFLKDDTTQIKKDKAKLDGLSLPKDKNIYLYIIKGPRSGFKFLLEKPRIIVGRGSEADLIIPDLEVSRKHCAIEVDDKKTILRDLNSTNGTFVDGEKIDFIKVEDRTEIQIGQSALLYMESEKGQEF